MQNKICTICFGTIRIINILTLTRTAAFDVAKKKHAIGYKSLVIKSLPSYFSVKNLLLLIINN